MTGTRVLTCDEALRMLADHLDRELDERSRDEVEQHLHTCRSCFSRAEFERRLKAQVGELRRTTVEPGFEQRIRALIGRFATETSVRPTNE
jgi:anti-sigma factor RsiW